MRKIGLFMSFAVVGAVCLFAGCKGPKKYKGPGPGTGEDIINLTWDPVLPAVEATYTTYASADITIGTTSVVTSTFTLTKADVTRLQYIADSLGAGVARGYVTAVQILYGVDTTHGSNSFDLFIRPLFLTCSAPPTAGSVYTYIANTSSLSTTNSYYLLSPTGTISKDVSNKNVVDAYHYRHKVNIIHYCGDTNTRFINGQDIESVIYPFQEIDTLMKANGDSALVLLNVGCPIICTTYACIRQSILLEPTGCPPGTSICSLFPQNCCADMTNLCPPDCPNTAITYVISTKY